MSSTVLLFVYGTLKQGFPNHHLNTGRRVPGRWRTRQAHPLWVVRLAEEDRAPWLVDAPGQGHCVTGEVYAVDAAQLPAIDAFEEVGLPCGYHRVPIDLDPVDDPAAATGALRAYAYLKRDDQWGECLQREGPFVEYTLGLAQGYWIGPAPLLTVPPTVPPTP